MSVVCPIIMFSDSSQTDSDITSPALSTGRMYSTVLELKYASSTLMIRNSTFQTPGAAVNKKERSDKVYLYL